MVKKETFIITSHCAVGIGLWTLVCIVIRNIFGGEIESLTKKKDEVVSRLNLAIEKEAKEKGADYIQDIRYFFGPVSPLNGFATAIAVKETIVSDENN